MMKHKGRIGGLDADMKRDGVGVVHYEMRSRNSPGSGQKDWACLGLEARGERSRAGGAGANLGSGQPWRKLPGGEGGTYVLCTYSVLYLRYVLYWAVEQ